MNIPNDLLFTKDHEWIKITDNTALVGITDFAQGELGDIVYLDIDKVGESIAEGAVFGTVEAVKTVSDLFMPVQGEILEVNTALDDNPALINSDPYGAGWIIKIQLTDSTQTDHLLNAADYEAIVG